MSRHAPLLLRMAVRLLPEDTREEILGDLLEHWRHEVSARSRSGRMLWLMRQPLIAMNLRMRYGITGSGSGIGHGSDRRLDIDLAWLDVKLGLRLIVKHPGLSIVSLSGMAVATAIAAGGFGFIDAIVNAELPLPEGDRVVSLQQTDLTRPGVPHRRSLHDFLRWREELRSVQDLSAFASAERGVRGGEGTAVAVPVAEMTASGFRVARTAPILGRVLLEEDEASAAPPVVIVAHEEWQRRFGGDPEIIGRTIWLDAAAHTVVGVMPPGFRFPVNHLYWVPLRPDASAFSSTGGPQIRIFGRLADRYTLEASQAELTAVGRRTAADHPQTHGHLVPEVLPYTHPFFDIDSPATAWVLRAVQAAFGLLIVVVAANVAILVYARTAARMGEIAVRSALGASRRRIVAQLFVEAVVLSSLAALVGLALAALELRWLEGFIRYNGGELPFWIDLRISPALTTYVFALVTLGGIIVGVLPGLKVSREAIRVGLQQMQSAGASLHLGRIWTSMIVIQVATAVAVLPYALFIVGPSVQRGLASPAYPVDEILRVLISPVREGPADSGERRPDDASAQTSRAAEDFLRRIAAEPAVSGVTFASHFPGNETVVQIEVEGASAQSTVWINNVGHDFFSVFGAPALAGRRLLPSDEAVGGSIVVDRVFATEVVRDGDVLGRRIRFVGSDESAAEVHPEWHEIVGIVPAIALPPALRRTAPKVYRAVSLSPLRDRTEVAVRTQPGTAPESFVGRLRELASSGGAGLRVEEVEPASVTEAERQEGLLFMALVVASLTASVLLLSAAGVYAMMSFTVASRRREIGLRAALGATPRQVLRIVFRRAGAQLGAGALAGLALAELISRAAGRSLLFGERPYLLPAVASVAVAIGLLAALGPARRGLAVPPLEALRED